MQLKSQVKLLIFCLLIMQSCKSQIGTFYTFKLFNDTPVQHLAQAIKNEDGASIKELFYRQKANINFQEPKYGNSLLITAVSNAKVKSIEILLALGADLLITNEGGETAINVASGSPSESKKSYEILKLLLAHGANVNQIEYGKGGNKGYVSIPLADAVGNFRCAKLLLENGGNIYFKANNHFIVWSNALMSYDNEGILFAKYLIIDLKKPIPINISYGVDKTPNDIFHFLNSPYFTKDPEIVKVKETILSYLKKIDFPNNQFYLDSSINHLNPNSEKGTNNALIISRP